jgi:ribosome maturation factor RimP
LAAHAEFVDAVCGLAAPICAQVGVELVEIRLSGSSRNRQVRVDVDRAGPGGIQLTDCQRVSEALGLALEEVDLFGDRYRLEVSSPGIDRPIRSVDDIRRNTGRRIQVTTTEPVDSRRTFRGVLVSADERSILLAEDAKDDEQRLRIPFDRIEKAFQDVPF